MRSIKKFRPGKKIGLLVHTMVFSQKRPFLTSRPNTQGVIAMNVTNGAAFLTPTEISLAPNFGEGISSEMQAHKCRLALVTSFFPMKSSFFNVS
jgi:hypothetical protein